MKTTIIGAGKFGSYFSQQLTIHGLETRTLDIGATQSEKEDTLGADLVIFAMPMRRMPDTLREYKDYIDPRTTVIDVCSVKLWAEFNFKKILGDKVLNIVGTHPLFGPQSAPDTMMGQRIAICPVQGTHEHIAEMFQDMRLKTIVCSADEHDRQIYTQVLNHFIGKAAHAAGVTRVELSTKTHDNFMNIVDLSVKNHPALFPDMNAYNPYARRGRQALLAALVTLDLETREAEDAPECKEFRDAFHTKEILAFTNHLD